MLLLASCTRDNFGAFSFDGGDDGGGGDGGSLGDGSAGGDGGGSTADMTFACTDVFGKYGMITAVGNCNDLNIAAPECVAGTSMACFAHFVSAPPQMTGAVNGGAQLDGNGAFSGAQLFLGTQKRSGCSGSYNALTGVITIMCGSGNELCTITMTKQGPCG